MLVELVLKKLIQLNCTELILFIPQICSQSFPLGVRQIQLCMRDILPPWGAGDGSTGI